MPSSPAKHRAPLGGETTGMVTRVASKTPEGAVAAKAGEVIVRKRNKSLAEQTANRAKKAVVKSAGKRIGSQGALVAEFVACVLILILSPLGKDVSAVDFMRRGTAVSLLFLILAAIGSSGPGARRAVTAFGGLLVLVVFLNQRGLLLTISGKLSGQSQAAIDAGNRSAALSGAPQTINTPTGQQTITVVPGPNGSWVAGNSADF